MFFILLTIGVNSHVNKLSIERDIINEKVEILVERKNKLFFEYKHLLDTNFRNHEIGIHDKWTNAVASRPEETNKSDLSINVLPSFPQTKYYESLANLVNRIEELNDQIYSQRLYEKKYSSQNRCI